MELSTKTFSQYVRDMCAAVQGSTAQLLDLSAGSVLRAILEANASVALWLQALIADVMMASRAGTARGIELDSWMADFSLRRLAATPAVGHVTLSRYSAELSVVIPPGTRVRTADASVTFRVVADQNHTRWDASNQTYLVPATVTGVDLPVEAETVGPGGNVLAETITLMVSSVAGVDTVINRAAMTGGLEAETDSAFRTRFIEYINSRSRGTIDAVAVAVRSVRQGLVFAIHENQAANGDFKLGHFVVVVDDGSGLPPLGLLEAVTAAIGAVRPVGTTFSVHPPMVVTAGIALAVTVPGASPSMANHVRDRVARAIELYVNRLPIGAALSVTRIAQVAYEASNQIGNVAGIRINGSDSDLVPGGRQILKSGLIAVS